MPIAATAYFRNHRQPYQQGFTLVEIMVVIVILTVFASMMTLSVGGSENRKNLAFYEHLQSNLAYVRLLSAEQMQPYGLAIKLPQGDNPKQLVVVKLDNAFTNQPSSQTAVSNQPPNANKSAPAWQLVKDIKPLELPPNLDITIQPVDAASAHSDMPVWLLGDQAPPVVWFGTGEATPVQITLSKQNPNDDTRYPVGNLIVVNGVGAIEVVP